MPHSANLHSQGPLALAIDIGSSSVRAVVFDARGRQLRDTEHRERYKLEITPDGGSMCDPYRIRRLTTRCVKKAASKAGARAGDIAVVGISCHWHSLMGLDANGTPVTPVYMWSDIRASRDADDLAAELLLDDTHARTGCRVHSSYWPAKLRWLKRTRPQVCGSVQKWCGLADWLVAADGSEVTTGLSMASATGMLNTAECAWDARISDHLELETGLLPRIVDRNTAYETSALHSDFAIGGAQPAWYPAIGDGGAANIGAGAVGGDRIALTIGTSGAIRVTGPLNVSQPLSPGLFRYLIDAETQVIGGALSNGGNMIAWLSNLTQSRDRNELMSQAARVGPDEHGLTVLPFFAGERAPSWQDGLGGTISGMSLDTTQIHIFRAMLEATAHRFAAVYDELKQFAQPGHDIIANGGALLQSPLWSQITADALGHRITALQTRAEASARGAAIAALNAAGHLPSLRTNPDLGRTYVPDTETHETYRAARTRLESLETALTQWEKNNR